MNFDLSEYHRKSLRLKGYDYCVGGVVPPTRHTAGTTPAVQAGGYFVTIVVWRRECLFGEIMGREMRLNLFGEIVNEEWSRSAEIRREIALDAFVVMPNHIHGIVFIHNNPVGAIGELMESMRQVPFEYIVMLEQIRSE